jgi:hypothetical protein
MQKTLFAPLINSDKPNKRPLIKKILIGGAVTAAVAAVGLFATSSYGEAQSQTFLAQDATFPSAIISLQATEITVSNSLEL